MPLLFRYESANNVFPDMGNDDFRFGDVTLAQNAQIGEPAISTLTADDPDGTQDYVGYRIFSARETSAPSNSQLIYRGRLARRTVRRNPEKGLITGTAREWEMEVTDQNVLLGWRFFMSSSADRPAETASDRLNWLVGTRRVPMYAHPTLCSAPATAMDANDYRQQRVGDVLADIATATGYNFWCDYDEGRERTELFFMNPNSSAYPSSLRISNDVDDYDGTTTFYPSKDAELSRDPSRIGASMLVPFGGSGGYVYDTKDSTGDTFAYVDQVAPVGNVKSRAKAQAIATRLLNEFDEEDDRITVSIDLPAAQVNDVRHGQTIEAKFMHLPGYEDFRVMRVAKRAVMQTEEIGQSAYRVRLELTPTGAAPYSCATSLGAAESSTSSGAESSGTTASNTIVVSSDGYVVGILIAANSNTPNSENMGHPSGYTEIDYQADYSRATWSIGYKSAAAGTHVMSASFTAGFGSVGGWAGLQMWLPWTALSVVQEKSGAPNARTATLDSSPTAGNTLLMFGISGSEAAMSPGDGGGPSTGWSVLGNVSQSLGTVQVTCWARCVEAGDGTVYDWAGGAGVLMNDATYIVEIAT